MIALFCLAMGIVGVSLLTRIPSSATNYRVGSSFTVFSASWKAGRHRSSQTRL